jgi:elongator complex protein 1
MTIEIQQFMKNGEIKVLASFPVSSPLCEKSQLLCFNHFVDTCQLVLVFQNGDIITATYEPAQQDFEYTVVEIVGSIDIGLLAASWSHDEETLAILTNENKLLLLSRLFEPIVEKELDSKDIHISDSKHVSVGWGKKETQFKGRGFKALEREKEALKHAGLNVDNETELRDPTVNELEKGTLSPFDTHENSISWRGDCEYFVVSTVESVVVEDTAEMYDRRVFRVFNREGVLDSVNEAVDGLEHCLAWKPQGALIASTQRHTDEDGDDVLDVVFYERNGLRHGQFNSRLNPELETIQNLLWSSDSEVLMFQLQDRIQLWTCKNYHWYLKQEIHINPADYANNQILFSKFHPEKPLHLMVATSQTGIAVFDLAYKTVNGSCILGNDLGMTLVVDGNVAKITPLSIANVPPPISFREIEIEENISDLAVSLSNEKYAILTSNNVIYTSQLSIEDMKKGQHPPVVGKIDITKHITETNPIACQVAFIGNSLLAVAIDCSFLSRVLLFDVEDVANPTVNDCVEISPKVVLMKSQANYEAIVAQTLDSRIIQINNQMDLTEIGKFPQLCRDFEVTCTDVENNVYTSFGISSNGKLFANENEVASGVTSLKITEAHLLFTTAQSQLCFAHLTSSHGDYKYQVLHDLHNDTLADERIRMIERGSILINVMPSKYTVVLEAPRGNLESICPRIMVLSGVRKFIKQKQYKKAFLSCRTHRIDLDILHDYAPELFLENVEHFINEIEKVEYLDLFVSCLNEQDVAQTKYRETKDQVDEISNDVANLSLTNKTQQNYNNNNNNNNNTAKRIIKNSDNEKFSPDSKVNKICNALLSVLQTAPYFEKYLQTIITAFACQKPPNLTEALSLIGDFKDDEQREQAVTHLCFLQDVNKLFDNALGLYDVKLALLIAQHSQKDPKEYLPFLQNLHIQPQLRRQFLIDDHLKKYEKALTWLFELGEDCNEEFDEYVVTHDLYKPAMTIYKYDDIRYNTILRLYAASLQTQQQFDMAALAFEYLGDHVNALVNYIHCKRWNEALAIAEISESKEKVIEVAENLISLLTQDHRYAEAAEIERHFMNNIEAAITLYCKNYHYDQAILLAVSERKSELLESVVDVQMGEGFGTIAELLADCKSQMNSQLRRIRELRAKKQEDPYSFYGQPNEDLDTPDNVSVAASETSTTPSFFTRYTGKTSGTAKTGASRRTAKNRKREERKRAKGRKGTIYEEEYLINSVGRLLERLDQTQPDAIRLIEGLIRRHRKEQAVQIQKNWCQLLDFIKENIVEIHDMSEKDRERFDDNGNVYLIPEIPVPTIKDFPKKDILDY